MGKRKIVATISILTLIISMFCFTPDVDAASAKSILNKAYKEMKKSGTVFYTFTYSYNDNGTKAAIQTGCSITDKNISHSWDTNEQWHIKSRVYTKSVWDSSWSVEQTDHDNKKPNKYYGKKLFQYTLKNLQNAKIKKTTKTTYVITGNCDALKDEFSKIEITINKNDKKAQGMIYYYQDSTDTDSYGENHIITNNIWKIDHMCYGNGKLKAPKLLK